MRLPPTPCRVCFRPCVFNKFSHFWQKELESMLSRHRQQDAPFAMAIHCVLQLSTVDCSCKPPARSRAAAVRAVVQLRMRASLLDLSADVIALLLPHWRLATCQAAACTCSSLHAAFRDALDTAAALLPPLRTLCHKVNTARVPMDPTSHPHGSAVQRCIADATRPVLRPKVCFGHGGTALAGFDWGLYCRGEPEAAGGWLAGPTMAVGLEEELHGKLALGDGADAASSLPPPGILLDWSRSRA